MAEEWGEDGYVSCSCCGTPIPDTPEDNMDFETRGCDRGYGECRECSDWSFHLVCDPIFDKVREALNDENRAKFDAIDDNRKAYVVQKLMDRGVLSWKIGG